MEFEIYFFNKNELCTNYLVRQPLLLKNKNYHLVLIATYSYALKKLYF